jgi:hypothetical protein
VDVLALKLEKAITICIAQMKEGSLFLFSTWFQLFQAIWICQKNCEAMRQRERIF